MKSRIDRGKVTQELRVKILSQRAAPAARRHNNQGTRYNVALNKDTGKWEAKTIKDDKVISTGKTEHVYDKETDRFYEKHTIRGQELKKKKEE
jgi:hypothetical protein